MAHLSVICFLLNPLTTRYYKYSEEERDVATNVARGKVVSQSSDGSGPADRAVDGDNNGFFADQACSQTQPDSVAWWMVDLGYLQLVTSVVIFNRADCCGELWNSIQGTM